MHIPRKGIGAKCFLIHLLLKLINVFENHYEIFFTLFNDKTITLFKQKMKLSF